MKNSMKIWLITFGIFFLLAALVVGGIFIGKAIINNRNDAAFEAHISQAKTNITAHLKEKYPDRTFEFINVKCDALEEGIAVTRAPKWSPDVWFEIKDNHGGIYVARSDTTLSGQAGIDSTQDNVQTTEIDDAVKKYLQSIIGVDESYMSTHSRVGAMYYLYHEKFNGDILEFARNTVEKNLYFEIYCNQTKVEIDKIVMENTDFFTLFDNILIVETEKDIQVNDLKHLVFNINNPELIIPEHANDVTCIYTFDENRNIVKQDSVLMNTEDYIYTYPYHNFEKQNFDKVGLNYVAISEWMPKIGELESQTGKIYSNITPITAAHFAIENFVYFVPYDTKYSGENKTFLLLTLVDGFNEAQYEAFEIGKTENAKIMGEYIYIGSMIQGKQWLIAAADIGNVPIRIPTEG